MLIRTIQNLSYYGLTCNYTEDNKVVKILINEELDLYVHIPLHEIKEIIYKNETIVNVEGFFMENENV